MYVTDGPISGAVGPSPEHHGAPAKGEGCDAEWEGATHMGMWGLPRMKKELTSRDSMFNFLIETPTAIEAP